MVLTSALVACISTAMGCSLWRLGRHPGWRDGTKSYRRRNYWLQLRDLLAEFLGDYVGTIGQLDQDDRITVCYQPKWPPRPAVADTELSTLSKQADALNETDFKKLVVAVPTL